MGSRTYNYYVPGYFGSCHYYFQFFDYHISTNELNDTLGHLTVQIAELPWDNGPPPEAVKDWTMIQCEDALIGEGGSDVMHRMEGPGGARPAGPPEERGARGDGGRRTWQGQSPAAPLSISGGSPTEERE